MLYNLNVVLRFNVRDVTFIVIFLLEKGYRGGGGGGECWWLIFMFFFVGQY